MYISTEEKQINETSPIQNYGSGSSPQFDLETLENKFYAAIQKQQADDKPFTISKRENCEALIVTVNPFTLAVEEAKKFRDLLTVSIKRGNNKFIIDLHNAHVMDSTFLGSVIVVLKKLKTINGKLVIVADPEKLKIFHTFTELNKILNVFADIDSAINKFR